MMPSGSAAIVSSDLDASRLQSLACSLRNAGFSEVAVFSDLPSLQLTGEGDELDMRLPDPWKELQVVVADEWIGGHSAFELFALLNATDGGGSTVLCLLTLSRDEATALAAWSAGVDILLSKESMAPADLERLIRRALERGPCAV